MPRRHRALAGGLIFHVMNRAVRRLTLFRNRDEYQAFLEVLCLASHMVPMRLLAYAVMPNHWHLVLWPSGDHDVSKYMHWMTFTHAQRWHAERASTGTGAVYQGRFKAVPVQNDGHLLTVCQYVERNALRAGLVQRAEEWPWSSAYEDGGQSRCPGPALTRWPVQKPVDWLARLNAPEPRTEFARLRRCLAAETPFGEANWADATTERLRGGPVPRRGRPRRSRGPAADVFGGVVGM